MAKNAIDRTLPEELADVARLAVASGLDKTVLHFEGLSHDFPAPIGWMLSISRVDQAYLNGLQIGGHDDEYAALTAERNHIAINVQIGDGVKAYVGDEDGESGTPYWGAERIKEWITTPLPGLELTESESESCRLDADWMIEAWRKGWRFERSVDRGQSLISRADDFSAPVSYSFEAQNWFYNVEGSPSHRSSGSEVSFGFRAMRDGLDGEWVQAWQGAEEMEGGGFRPLSTPIERMLDWSASTPPWSARVAYLDDETDDDDWEL